MKEQRTEVQAVLIFRAELLLSGRRFLRTWQLVTVVTLDGEHTSCYCVVCYQYSAILSFLGIYEQRRMSYSRDLPVHCWVCGEFAFEMIFSIDSTQSNVGQ